MHFEDTLTIQARRERVWAFLTDPDSVASCVPGLETLEVVTPNQKLRAVAAVGLGTVKVRFATDVEWTDLEAPHRAGMKLHGTAPGSAMDGQTSMILSDGPGGSTELAWSADVTIVGTIASLAARLMGGVAKKLTGEFFNRVRRKIEARSRI